MLVVIAGGVSSVFHEETAVRILFGAASEQEAFVLFRDHIRDIASYFAINDNVDLALRGEIYTKGSWGISAHSSYVKRYKFRGSFDISFLTTISGDKGSWRGFRAGSLRPVP